MSTISRADLFKMAGASLVGASLLGLPVRPAAADSHLYTLPELPYDYDALEPAIDKQTLTIHHDRHHQGYVNGLNSTLEAIGKAQKAGDFSDMQKLSRKLAFHGSGHVLHTIYWESMTPKKTAPKGALLKAIEKDFGSVDTLKGQLGAAAGSAAGSGWGLLAYEPVGDRLVVVQIEKHENQIFCGVVPLMVIDVWEHAYYLKYQNRRGDYVKAVLDILDWDSTAARYAAAVKAR